MDGCYKFWHVNEISLSPVTKAQEGTDHGWRQAILGEVKELSTLQKQMLDSS